MGADVIVAGRQIDITRPVAGDILAAGWRVVLSDRADDDVRIAAGEVNVDAPVGRSDDCRGRRDHRIAHVRGRSQLADRRDGPA